jgi:hypothetical protein
VKKGSGSKTLPSSNSPSRAVESPTMGRRLPADPAEAIGTAVVKYNYQVQQLLKFNFLFVLHLIGIVVRVPGYRSRGPGFDFRHYQIF